MEPIETLPALIARLRKQSEDISAQLHALCDEEDSGGDMDWEARLDLEEDGSAIGQEALEALEGIAADARVLIAADDQSDFHELVMEFLQSLAGAPDADAENDDQCPRCGKDMTGSMAVACCDDPLD